MQPHSPSALEPRLKSGWKRACARSHSCMSEHYFSRGRGARDEETSSIARGARGFNCTRENAAVRGHGTEDLPALARWPGTMRGTVIETGGGGSAACNICARMKGADVRR